MTQFVYATMEGTIYRFRRLAWLEWLQFIAKGGDKYQIEKYGDRIGVNEAEMVDWKPNDAQTLLTQAISRNKVTAST